MARSSLCSRSSYNIQVVSWGFMVLFVAYNTLQNYATSLFPAGLGNKSLAVLYAACAVCVFAAPGLTNQIGPRATMVLGAACYVAYMLSLIQIVDWVVLLMSTVIGFGGAILWIAMGVYISQNSTKKTYGRNLGTFWSIFQLCNIVGNLVTYFVFSKLSSTTWLYVGFAVIGSVGTAMLLFLRKAEPESDEDDEDGADGRATARIKDARPTPPPRPFSERFQSFLADLGKAARLICTRNMVLLMPMYFFSGLELSVSSRSRSSSRGMSLGEAHAKPGPGGGRGSRSCVGRSQPPC
jgi:MFS family permease